MRELKSPYFVRGTDYSFTIELQDDTTGETIDLTQAEAVEIGIYEEGTRRLTKTLEDELTVNADGSVTVRLTHGETAIFQEGQVLVQTFYTDADGTKANATPSVIYVYEKYT